MSSKTKKANKVVAIMVLPMLLALCCSCVDSNLEESRIPTESIAAVKFECYEQNNYKMVETSNAVSMAGFLNSLKLTLTDDEFTEKRLYQLTFTTSFSQGNPPQYADDSIICVVLVGSSTIQINDSVYSFDSEVPELIQARFDGYTQFETYTREDGSVS